MTRRCHFYDRNMTVKVIGKIVGVGKIQPLAKIVGAKKTPHHAGEDRDGDAIHSVTQWNKRIYSNHRLHIDYTSITRLGLTLSFSLTLVQKLTFN